MVSVCLGGSLLGWRDSGRDVFLVLVCEEDDEEVLKWVVFEKFFIYNCVRKGILIDMGLGGVIKEIDVDKFGV